MCDKRERDRAVKVQNGGHVKPAFFGLNVGDISDPDLVGRSSLWGLGQAVGGNGLVMVAVSGLNAVAAFLTTRRGPLPA